MKLYVCGSSVPMYGSGVTDLACIIVPPYRGLIVKNVEADFPF